MKNGIVIPCYNEANRLKFNEFQSFIDSNNNYVLCFVNDGSSDKTLDQITAFSQNQKDRVLVLDLTLNSGKAEAVRLGVKHLLDNTDVHNVGFMDADLATGFDDYRRLVGLLSGQAKAMAFGSRKMDMGKAIERSFFRSLVSNIIGVLIRFIIGMPILDTQCGAKVFSRMTAENIFSKSFISRWLFDVEIFIKMRNLYGAQVMDNIEEVPLNSWEEVEGSKITLKDSMKFPMQLVEIGYDYNVKPIFANINDQMKSIARVVAFRRAA